MQAIYYEKLVVFTTPNGHVTCGYPFTKGETYLVYAFDHHDHDGMLYTGAGVTHFITDSFIREDLDFLGEGSVPTSQLTLDEQIRGITFEPPPPPRVTEEERVHNLLLMIGTGVTIATATSFFALRRIRRNK